MGGERQVRRPPPLAPHTFVTLGESAMAAQTNLLGRQGTDVRLEDLPGVQAG